MNALSPRHDSEKTLITCQCMKDSEGENRRRLKACYSCTYDNYWLARWSYNGSEHASACQIPKIVGYSPGSASSA